MKGPIFTVSNGLSILRIILILPIAVLLENDSIANTTSILVLAFLSCVTDFFDGYFARKLNQVSDLGKILDPVADKFAIGIIAVSLHVQRGFPLWLVILILSRDFLIMLAALFVIGRQKIIMQSNIVGKITVGVIASTILIYIGNFEFLYPWFNKISLTAVIISGLVYTRSLIKLVRIHQKAGNVHDLKSGVTMLSSDENKN